MIFAGSRYETADVTPVADAQGVYRATVIPTRTVAETTDYTEHRVRVGDRMDTLARIAYGDPEMWWRIADANPQLAYPDQLVPGALIKIPRAGVTL